MIPALTFLIGTDTICRLIEIMVRPTTHVVVRVLFVIGILVEIGFLYDVSQAAHRAAPALQMP